MSTIRTYPYPSGPGTDDARADRLRCLWHAVADWADDQAGTSTDGPIWGGLLGRRVATEDENGFRTVYTYPTEDEARAFLACIADYVTPGWREDGGQA